jgi:hypothetical protein
MLRELKRAIFGKKKKRSKQPATTLVVKDSLISHPSSVIHDQVLDQVMVDNQPPVTIFPTQQTESYAQTRGITAPLPPANHPLMTLFQSLPQASLTVSLTQATPQPAIPASSAKRVTKPKATVSPFKLIPIITAVAVFVSVSGSYFLDHEISFDNLLAAGTWSSPDTFPSVGGLAQSLVINEILPQASCVQGKTEAGWLEIYNGHPYSVNLKDYQITDGTTPISLVNAGNIDVPAGGLALLSHNTSIWNQCWSPPSDAITANLGGQLNLNTGTFQLIDPQGTVIDTVIWGSGQTQQPAIDQSLERTPTGWDTAFGSNFNPEDFTIPATPSPGD